MRHVRLFRAADDDVLATQACVYEEEMRQDDEAALADATATDAELKNI
jgi:hypothetical protein